MAGDNGGGRFAGQVAVVTGGASGIGLAILRGLHAEGASILCADINSAALDAVAAAFPDRVACLEADVTREDAVEAMMDEAVSRFGGLDLSFHVAGGNRGGYVLDQPEADWDFTLALCLKSVFLCTKHAARRMLPQGKTRGSGAIVNIASLNAHVPMHGGAAYASAKAGCEMLTRNAALELTPSGIRVNAVLPGLVQTPLTRRHFDNPLAHAAFVERIPAGRAAQPEEIAGPALFLASAAASYVSGASLLVDGAWAVSGYPDMRPFRGEPLWGRGNR